MTDREWEKAKWWMNRVEELSATIAERDATIADLERKLDARMDEMIIIESEARVLRKQLAEERELRIKRQLATPPLSPSQAEAMKRLDSLIDCMRGRCVYAQADYDILKASIEQANKPKLCGPSAFNVYRQAWHHSEDHFKKWYHNNILPIDAVRAEDAARIAELEAKLKEADKCWQYAACDNSKAQERIAELEAVVNGSLWVRTDREANERIAELESTCNIVTRNLERQNGVVAEQCKRIAELEKTLADERELSRAGFRFTDLERETRLLCNNRVQELEEQLAEVRDRCCKAESQELDLQCKLLQRIADPTQLTARQQVALAALVNDMDGGEGYAKAYALADAFLAAGEGEQ